MKYDNDYIQKELDESYVIVDGKTVFTSKWIWSQMMAQSCRIDRSNTIAWTALASSILANIVLIIKAIL